MKFSKTLTVLLLLGISWAALPARSQSEIGLEEPFSLSLSELSQVQVIQPATLLPTEARLIPAALSVLTQTEIQESGARDLDELLEIYVPGLQLFNKSQANMIGMRGLISDRNNKLLLLVN